MAQSLLRELGYHLTLGTGFQPPAPRAKTACEIATSSLEKAKIELLEQCELAEFHTGMVTMLRERIVRLRQDIRALSAEPSPEELQ